MLIAISALKSYAIQASDGVVGQACDFLFDETTCKLRWIVADLGTWLRDRQLLLPPSSVLKADHERQILMIGLCKAQVEAGPPIFEHDPISEEMKSHLANYYGSTTAWGERIFDADAFAPPLSMGARFGADPGSRHGGPTHIAGDPHRCRASEVEGYSIHATDGLIGHVENFLVDDEHWEIRFIVVDTKNWWPGKHVLVPRAEVREIDHTVREIKLGLDRNQIRAIPPWDPIAMMDKVYDKLVPNRDGWHGVGF